MVAIYQNSPVYGFNIQFSSTVNCYFLLRYQCALCLVNFFEVVSGPSWLSLFVALFPALFTEPLMRMTDLLRRLKFLN